MTTTVPSPRGDVDLAYRISLESQLAAIIEPRWRADGRREAYLTLGRAWGAMLRDGAFRTPDPGQPTDVTVALGYLDKHSNPRKVARDAAHRLPHADGTTRIMSGGGTFARHYLPINPDAVAAVIAAAKTYLDTCREIEVRYLESLAANSAEIARLRAAIQRAETAAANPPPTLEPTSA